MKNIISMLKYITKNKSLKPVTSKNVAELKQNLNILITEAYSETE